jgi:aspartate racemase
MKTIGLLGGMSWESSAHYYALINREVRQKLGGLHSAKLLMASVDFAEVAAMQRADQWQQAGELLAQQARNLQLAGAELLLIGTNTMHKVADTVAQAIDIPLLHIADPTAQALTQQSFHRVALLGTQFTMAETFYRGRLETQFNLDVLTTTAADQQEIHRIIFDELCVGQLLAPSRATLQRIIDQLRAAGAQAVILGCTELGLLIDTEHSALPLFDTTALHARAAVTLALR